MTTTLCTVSILFFVSCCFIVQTANSLETKKAINQFSYELYQELRDKSSNIVVSPIGAYTLLMKVAMGATSYSAANLNTLLKVPAQSREKSGKDMSDVINSMTGMKDSILILSNQIFVASSYNVKKDFEDNLFNYFESHIYPINLNKASDAASKINSYFYTESNFTISEMISPDFLKTANKMLLLNANVCNGQLDRRFQNKEEGKFVTENGPITVSMLKATGDFDFGTYFDAKVLRLSSSVQSASFFFFLPNEPDGMEKLERKLNLFRFPDMIEKLDLKKVSVSIPEFDIRSEYGLQNALQKISRTNIFGNDATFKDLAKNPDGLKVSAIRQKSSITFNRYSYAWRKYGAFDENYTTDTFVADRPFLFMIADTNQNMVFLIGRCTKPEFVASTPPPEEDKSKQET